jgi:hypothetical protein
MDSRHHRDFLREVERINLASAVGTVLVLAGVVAIALAQS